MIVVKNSPGISFAMNSNLASPSLLDTFSGSALNRKKGVIKTKKSDYPINDKVIRQNVLSGRSKSKIRLKIFALAGIEKKLVFLTLTFVNMVEDRKANEILKCFLENAKKRKPEFEYLWVAEKQTKNLVFPNNIHFHIVTNVYWDIDHWKSYWVDLQAKFGVKPREGVNAGSSAFDVKLIKSSNKKAIGNYIAGYLSKSSETFDCRVWHCSRGISNLYTGFYSGIGFINQLERLNEGDMLGGELRKIPTKFCLILLIPLNQKTEMLYERIHVKNRLNWFSKN